MRSEGTTKKKRDQFSSHKQKDNLTDALRISKGLELATFVKVRKALQVFECTEKGLGKTDTAKNNIALEIFYCA